MVQRSLWNLSALASMILLAIVAAGPEALVAQEVEAEILWQYDTGG